MTNYIAALVATACTVLCVDSAAPQQAHYHVVNQIHLDSGGADFLVIDSTNRRLYGASRRVIDIDSDVVVGSLPLHTGLAFAIAPELNRGLGRRGVLFDLKSFEPLGKAEVSADAMIYEPTTQRAFALLDGIDVIDMRNGSVITHLRLTDSPHESVRFGVSDGKGLLYISVTSRRDTTSDWVGRVVVLRASDLKILKQINLPNCRVPLGVAMDIERDRLFVSCAYGSDGSIVVIAIRQSRVVARVPIDAPGDAIVFDSASRLIFNPGRSGRLTIVHEDSPDRYSVQDTIQTEANGGSLAFDKRSHKLYLFRELEPGVNILVLHE